MNRIYILTSLMFLQVSVLLGNDDLLKSIDLYRIPLNDKSFVVFVEVKSLSSDGRAKEEEDKAQVFLDNTNQATVFLLSNKSKRQKVLLLNDAVWFHSPNLQKPVRITAQQRVMGNVSFGDIGKMRLYGDYIVEKIEKDIILPKGKAFEKDKTGYNKLILLHLKAKTASAPYPSIRLWIDEVDNKPFIAEYLLKSGKAIKYAWFDLPEQYQNTDKKEEEEEVNLFFIQKITILDAILLNKIDEMKIVKVTPKEISKSIFGINTFYK